MQHQNRCSVTNREPYDSKLKQKLRDKSLMTGVSDKFKKCIVWTFVCVFLILCKAAYDL